MDEKLIKKYGILFFVVSLSSELIQIISYLENYKQLSGFFFLLLLGMAIVWSILLGNKNLTNFELFITVFVFLGVIFQLIFGIAFFLESFFQYALGISFIYSTCIVIFTVGLCFWAYIIFKRSDLKHKKIKIYRRDLIMIYLAIIVLTIVILSYKVF